jgi:hypothetical protein
MRSSLNNTQQKASWQQLANMNLDDLEGGDWEYGEGTHDEWGFKLEARAGVGSGRAWSWSCIVPDTR